MAGGGARSGAAGSVPGRWARPSAATPRPGSAWCTSAPTGTRRRRSRSRRQIPDAWDCPRCGLPASLDPDNPPPPPKIEPYKTHLAYVKERRCDQEAAEILDEALGTLRDRRKRGEIIFYGRGSLLRRRAA